MMKLFIFFVFALTVFARESRLSSEVSDIFSEVMEEHSAEFEAAVGAHGRWCCGKWQASRRCPCKASCPYRGANCYGVTASLIFFPFSTHLFYLARNSVTDFLPFSTHLFYLVRNSVTDFLPFSTHLFYLESNSVTDFLPFSTHLFYLGSNSVTDFLPFSTHLFYLGRNSVTDFFSIFNPFILSRE